MLKGAFEPFREPLTHSAAWAAACWITYRDFLNYNKFWETVFYSYLAPDFKMSTGY